MQRILLVATWALTASSFIPSLAANDAANVIDYRPGTGAAAGYDQSSSILGEPSRVTPGDFGGPVDPFSAAWQPGQLLSIGASGSVTVRFAEPVLNLDAPAFGMDFLVFGGSAFVITNGDFSGGGVTDGSLFGNNSGATRVSVSPDGQNWYVLDPSKAPTVDGLFPTDGLGDFSQPVNPALHQGDFAGLGLAQIRQLYAGSGGGTGFDIGWAQDNAGAPFHLDQIQFARIDVLSDRAEIDAITAVPEPEIILLLIVGAAVTARPFIGRRRA